MRIVLHIGLLLLAGAFINCLVAWSSAALLDRNRLRIIRPPVDARSHHARVRPRDAEWWSDRAPGRTSRSLLEVSEQRGLFLTVEVFTAGDPGSIAHDYENGVGWSVPNSWKQYDQAVLVTTGFPCRSFVGERWEIGHSSTTLRTVGPRLAAPQVTIVGAWDAGGSPGSIVPHDPIGAGFIANTLFYALLCVGCLLALRLARGFLRRISGCCPRCGYDLHASRGRSSYDFLKRGCPECGWNRDGQPRTPRQIHARRTSTAEKTEQ